MAAASSGLDVRVERNRLPLQTVARGRLDEEGLRLESREVDRATGSDRHGRRVHVRLGVERSGILGLDEHERYLVAVSDRGKRGGPRCRAPRSTPPSLKCHAA